MKFLSRNIIIVTLFSLIYALAGYLLLDNLATDAAFTKRELQGLHYHQPFMRLVSALQDNRPEFQAHIDNIDKLLANDPAAPLDQEEWRHIRSSVISLQGASARTCEQYCAQLQDLMRQIGDRSGLILEPELITYYLMDVSVIILPKMLAMIEYIQEAVATKQTFLPEQVYVSLPSERIFGEYEKTLNRSIAIVWKSQQVRGNLRQSYENLSRVLKEYKQYVTPLKVKQSVNWQQFMDVNSRAIGAIESMYMSTLNQLELRLQQRLRLQQNIYAYSFGFIVFVYFVLLAADLVAVRNFVSAKEVKAAREKGRLLEELKMKNQELEKFAFIVSHDLKEPVRTLANFATLLKQDCGHALDDQGWKYATVIRSSAQRLERMITDIYSYINLEHNIVGPSLCDAEEEFRQILVSLQSLLGNRSVRIVSRGLPQLYINAAGFNRLLQNLLCNSIKYARTDVQTEVIVSAERRRRDWLFAVKDNGIGIGAEYVTQIFQPFKRLHGQTHSEGTGIGLAICRKIVNQMGGVIWVESVLGEGSVFYFTIPVAAEAGMAA